MNDHPVDPREKALKVNLDPRFYGAFAEIGAGQEVVRWFFRAGGAAGTIAKSISAYDMKVSDAIYGACARYVCRERLEAMLEHEQRLNLERLSGARGSSTAFFAFADTVSARSFRGNNECHGWMGIKFQSRPGAQNQQIVIHVRMLDHDNAAQQEALGIVGVNLRLRRVLLLRRAREAARVVARRTQHEPHRDRPDRFLRRRVRRRRQSRDEPAARAARPHGRGHVLGPTAKCCSLPRCCTRNRCSWRAAGFAR